MVLTLKVPAPNVAHVGQRKCVQTAEANTLFWRVKHVCVTSVTDVIQQNSQSVAINVLRIAITSGVAINGGVAIKIARNRWRDHNRNHQ